MNEKIISLKKRIEAFEDNFNSAFAEQVLADFEELASSDISSLCRFFKIKEKDEDTKQQWKGVMQTLQKMDLLLGNEAPPDRPWTRIFFRRNHLTFDYSANEFAQDLNMIGSRLRSEEEMDRLLQAYFLTITECVKYRDTYDIDDSWPRAQFETLDGTIYNADQVYYMDGDNAEVDESVMVAIVAAGDAAIETVISMTISLSKNQWESLCGFRLAEMLSKLEECDRLWRLFVTDHLANGNLLALSFRAKLLAAVQGFSIYPYQEDKSERGISWTRDYLSILRRSVFQLLDWVKEYQSKEEQDDNYRSPISFNVVEEIRFSLLHSLILRNPLREVLDLEEETSLGDCRALDDALGNLFDFYANHSTEEGRPKAKIDTEIPALYQTATLAATKSVELMRKAFPIIESKQDFLSFLKDPKQFVPDSEKRRFVLSRLEAVELCLPEETDLLGEYVKKNNQLLEAKDQIEALKKENLGKEDANKKIQDIIGPLLRTDLDRAKSQASEFEKYWQDQVRDIYIKAGDKTEKNMFDDLFAEIDDPNYERRPDRGKIDGAFGQGKLLFSDLQHFFALHWEKGFKSRFKSTVGLTKITQILRSMNKNRNVLSHPQEDSDKADVAAGFLLAQMKEFNSYLSK